VIANLQTMKRTFLWFALGTGLAFSLILTWDASENSSSNYQLPLLTILLMSEFGCLVNAIAAGIGIRNLSTQGFNKLGIFILLGNLILTVSLFLAGLKLWQRISGG
jgi:hypothetical protein